jgi:DNA-binding PadR family transcriptional regulator
MLWGAISAGQNDSIMTDAELTLLSLLAQGSRTGQNIQHMIDERGLRDWLAVGVSSVFVILDGLVDKGFLDSEMRPSDGANLEKHYRLTDAGRGVLQTALVNLLREPHAFGTGFELGLANLHVLKPVQVYRALWQHQQELRGQYQDIQQAWDDYQDSLTHEPLKALYTHSLARMKADLAWLDTFLADWRRQHPHVEPDQQRDEDTAPAERRPAPDPLKLLQRMKRLPPQSPQSSRDSDTDSPDTST